MNRARAWARLLPRGRASSDRSEASSSYGCWVAVRVARRGGTQWRMERRAVAWRGAPPVMPDISVLEYAYYASYVWEALRLVSPHFEHILVELMYS